MGQRLAAGAKLALPAIAGRGKPLSEIAQPFPIDDGLVFNQLAKWVPDEATRKKILVDNPARLYGFGNKAS